MKRKAYILIFDRDNDMDFKELHNKITGLPDILSWWHYIKSSYIIITKATTATMLTEQIKSFFPPGKSILIVEVNLKNRNGLLPQQAWDWLKRQRLKIDMDQTS